MTLEQLCGAVPDARVPAAAKQLRISGVQDDSRAVRPGDVFVAVPGEERDGRAHAAQAVERGAIVVVSETPVDVAVPVVLVSDARRALASMAAAAAGNPAHALRRVGITGTLGKTSVLTMLSEILRVAGIQVGTVGSLGIEHEGGGTATPNTTPGALQLQTALAEMAAAGTRVLAMEVTSHALVQGRVHGLTYDLGVFTNLTMLEHLDYHGSFAGYVAAKRQFLDHLTADAPLIYSVGDRAVRAVVEAHGGPLISCGGHPGAHVSVQRERSGLDGARISLRLNRPLPRLDAAALPPFTLPLRLSTLGRTSISNASLAAVAALCVGASADAVRQALRSLPSPPRRLEVIRRADPCIIDDTVGHPDSITGVFEVARRIPHERLHIVFCIRGRRGAVINARDAEALAIWSRLVPVHRIVVTSAADTADERNTVSDEEREAFMRVLGETRIPHEHHTTLSDAIDAAFASAGAGDLFLLLGAQGMDAGAELVRQKLGTPRRQGPR